MIRFVSIVAFLMAFVSCQEGTPKKVVPPTRDLLKGKKLYSVHCAGCHQDNGEGYKKVYPPLMESDYLTEHFDDLACIIRYGLEGEIVVNGQSYHYKMTAINGVDDHDISAIINYIAFTYQIGDGQIMTRDKVKEITSKCD